MIRTFNYIGCNKLNYFTLLFITLFLSSCISTNKIVYLNDDGKEGAYDVSNWEHKIQVGDRFSFNLNKSDAEITLESSELISGTDPVRTNILPQMPSVSDYVVKSDGTLDLPMIGKTMVIGKTLDELPDFVTQQYKGYLSNPSVKIFMTNYNVTVLGETFQPGFYQLITHRPTFFDAIGLSGDLTDFADRSSIQFIRKSEGKVIIEYVNVKDPNFIFSPYYYIHPNDVIHIRPLKVKKFRDGNALPLILSTITTIFTLFTLARTY